ncbi:MAG: 50S ribosomal protein L25 [Acidimicrobiales bacterium]|nr:50S ribosomal protein L25 [Acidimicrobiales bacterium]
MAEIKLHATTGRALGNGPSRRIRAEGKVPAVVYGLDADPVAITVDWRPLRAALTTEAGLNVLVDLEIDGKVDLTIVKELQRHPIRGDVLHVDFLRVSADAAITVEVPIVLEGEAKEVTNEGGTVDQVLFTLSVNAKPADIPNELTVDISGLTIGEAIRVSDVTLPAGVTTDVDPDEHVVSGLHGVVEEEAPAEGEEGEAEAPSEAGADGGDADGEGSEG